MTDAEAKEMWKALMKRTPKKFFLENLYEFNELSLWFDKRHD